jgi:GNAT superfamily N-acetyltransferase
MPVTGDYVSVGPFSFVLRRATPRHLPELRGLTEEAVKWLRAHKDTDQWSSPWPDLDASIGRMEDDLRKRKTWLVRDGDIAAGTITIDRHETLAAHRGPVWPESKRHEPDLYVRRLIVSRRYAGIGLGAALLDWAADFAKRNYGVTLIRVDVWTTNLELHRYYERRGFTPCRGRDAAELAGYPSQALFERGVDRAGSDYADLFTEEAGPPQ